ncbi:MAG: hypothetical protein OXT09_00820 [Myxococcales bacterium]|nr:hypothetical protein [Myxococcales bacterium]
MAIEIRQHEPGKDLKDFMRVPHLVLANDPTWIAPLNMLVKEQLTPAKNPFFEHADVALFTAWKDGQLVGRISAQIDREHLKKHQDGTGFFGFFDTTDDAEVGQALVDAAAGFLRERGMKRMRGPLSLSINEETGMLVDGFDYPPMMMCPHHARYQSAIAESAGLSKEMDLFGWRYVVEELPRRVVRAHEAVTALPEVQIRTLDKKNVDAELKQVLEVWDDAWKDNWAHVSMTEAEVKAFVDTMKLIIEEQLSLIAEIDGEPAAICFAAPNLNEAARDLGGKLSPMGVAKLAWRMLIKKPRTARLILLGVKEKFRVQRKYGYLPMAMVYEIKTRGEKLGYEWGELGWTLESNAPVNVMIRAMGCKPYKTYRVFEKTL